MKNLTSAVLAVVMLVLATFASAQPSWVTKPRKTSATETSNTPPPSASPSPSGTPVVEDEESTAEATPSPTPVTPEDILNEVKGIGSKMGNFSKLEEELRNARFVLKDKEAELENTQAELKQAKAEMGLSWSAVAGIALFFFALGAFRPWGLFKKAAGVLLALGLTTQAQAATASQKCEPVIISDGIVAMGGDTSTEKIRTNAACGKITEVVVDESQLKVTKFVVEGNLITIDVVATATEEGGVSCTPKNVKGKALESGKAYFLILSGPHFDALNRAEGRSKAANAKTSKEVAAFKAETNQNLARLNTRVDAVAMMAVTEAQVKTWIAEGLKPMQDQLKTTGDITLANHDQLQNVDAQLLGVNERQVALGRKKVGGFLGIGKKPLDEEVADAAEKAAANIKAALAQRKK